MWSRNVGTALQSGRRRISTPHNHGRGQRDCNHSSTELSVRHVVMLDSAVPATGPLHALRELCVWFRDPRRRIDLSSLRWHAPSQWLMVTRSTAVARRKVNGSAVSTGMRMDALGDDGRCCYPMPAPAKRRRRYANTESGHRFASVIAKNWAGSFCGRGTEQTSECVRRLGP